MSDSNRDFGASSDNAIKRRKILAAVRANKDIIAGNDGYRVFWPDSRRGGMDAFALRAIADELDRVNKEWDEQVQREIPVMAEKLRDQSQVRAIVTMFGIDKMCDVTAYGEPQERYPRSKTLFVERGEDEYAIPHYQRPFCTLQRSDWLAGKVIDLFGDG